MTTARTMICLCVLANCALAGSGFVSDEDAAEAELTVRRILEVCDVVAEKHVEPPVKQQLVLLAARSLYESREKPAPRELSDRISQLSTDEQFEELLADVTSEIGEVDGSMVIENLLSRIPGGGTWTAAQE